MPEPAREKLQDVSCQVAFAPMRGANCLQSCVALARIACRMSRQGLASWTVQTPLPLQSAAKRAGRVVSRHVRTRPAPRAKRCGALMDSARRERQHVPICTHASADYHAIEGAIPARWRRHRLLSASLHALRLRRALTWRICLHELRPARRLAPRRLPRLRHRNPAAGELHRIAPPHRWRPTGR